MGLRYCPKTTSGSNISTQNDFAGISYKLSYRQQIKIQIMTLLSSKGQYLGLIYFKNLPKNDSDKPLTSRCTDGGKNRKERQKYRQRCTIGFISRHRKHSQCGVQASGLQSNEELSSVEYRYKIGLRMWIPIS